MKVNFRLPHNHVKRFTPHLGLHLLGHIYLGTPLSAPLGTIGKLSRGFGTWTSHGHMYGSKPQWRFTDEDLVGSGVVWSG